MPKFGRRGRCGRTCATHGTLAIRRRHGTQRYPTRRRMPSPLQPGVAGSERRVTKQPLLRCLPVPHPFAYLNTATKWHPLAPSTSRCQTKCA
jgi:hypothetical protein